MCFAIRYINKAERAILTNEYPMYGYKVMIDPVLLMKGRPGIYASFGARLFRSKMMPAHWWALGVWVDRSRGPSEEYNSRVGHRRALHGIYVYHHLRDAEDSVDVALNGNYLVVVKAEVQGLLCRSDPSLEVRDLRTYERARIVEVL